MKKYALIYQPSTNSYITVNIKFLNEHIHKLRSVKPITVGLLWEVEKASNAMKARGIKSEPHSSTSSIIQHKVYGEHNLIKH